MAYFNNTNNTNFYPTPSASGEFNTYPFLNHASATEDVTGQVYDTFTSRWQPGPMVGSPANHGKYHRDLFVV